MLIAGVSSKKEACLVVEGGLSNLAGGGSRSGGLAIEPCAKAIKAGDGREIFRFQPDGQLVTLQGNQCVELVDDPGGARYLELTECKDPHLPESLAWQVTGNNNLEAKSGLCLTLEGKGTPGDLDAALGVAVRASSSADLAAHPPGNVVDGKGVTYWASGFDPGDPVTLLLNLDITRKVNSIHIKWECQPDLFTIETTNGQNKWATAWVEDEFMNQTKDRQTHVELAGRKANAVRITMHPPASPCKTSGGDPIFAIRQVQVNTPRLRPTVEPCSDVKNSTDARGHWFLSQVSEFKPRIPEPQFLKNRRLMSSKFM